MKKFTLLLVALMCFTFGHSQSLPIDFEASQPFIEDSGAAVSAVDDGSGSNQVLEIVGNGSQWDNAQVTFAAPLDLSNSAANTIKFRFKSTTAGPTDVNEHLLKFELPVSGGDTEKTFTTVGSDWHDFEIDMDLGSVMPPTSYSKMVVMVDWGGGPSSGVTATYYIDDISIGATTPGTDATLSDLQVDAVTVPGFDAATLGYTYAVPSGTTVVPTVTATTNDAGASAVVTPASGLPGDTTVLVTAPDGTTTQSYVVSFVFPVELPFDFETSQPFSSPGDEIGLSVIDDGSGSNDVLQLVGGIADWDSAQVTFTTPIDLSDDANNTLRFTFQSTTAAPAEVHQHGISFQGGGGAIEANFITTGTTPVDVELDFNAGLGSRNSMFIFIDVGDFGAQSATGGQSGSPSNGSSGTYLLDNISLGATVLSTDDFLIADFTAYPNPTTDKWNIKTNGQDITSVQVFDMLGKNVISLTPNRNSVEVDASNLPAGLYFARLTSGSGTKSVKLVKQ